MDDQDQLGARCTLERFEYLKSSVPEEEYVVCHRKAQPRSSRHIPATYSHLTFARNTLASPAIAINLSFTTVTEHAEYALTTLLHVSKTHGRETLLIEGIGIEGRLGMRLSFVVVLDASGCSPLGDDSAAVYSRHSHQIWLHPKYSVRGDSNLSRRTQPRRFSAELSISANHRSGTRRN